VLQVRPTSGVRGRVQGMQTHPQKFWFVTYPVKIPENVGKIPENMGKILENPGKIPENLKSGVKWRPILFHFKKWNPTFAVKQIKTF